MATAAYTVPRRGLLESLGLERTTATKILVAVIIVIALIWTLFPIFYIFGNSFKTRLAMFSYDLVMWPDKPTLKHYIAAFIEQPFLRFMLNSVIVAAASMALSLVFGTLAAYGLARFRYPANMKFHISFFILSVRMMPPIVSILPLFLFFNFLSLTNTKLALVIAYTGFNLPFVVWMMKGYIQEIPRELEESAMVDGDTRLGAFWRIILPLAAPGLAATAIFSFILSWNEFLYALILTDTVDAKTLPVGIVGRITKLEVKFGEMSAAGFASMVPIVIFAFIVQRHLVRGLSFGAVRG